MLLHVAPPQGAPATGSASVERHQQQQQAAVRIVFVAEGMRNFVQAAARIVVVGGTAAAGEEDIVGH